MIWLKSNNFYHVHCKDVFVDRILYERRDYLHILFGDISDMSMLPGKQHFFDSDDMILIKGHLSDKIFGGASKCSRDLTNL